MYKIVDEESFDCEGDFHNQETSCWSCKGMQEKGSYRIGRKVLMYHLGEIPGIVIDIFGRHR